MRFSGYCALSLSVLLISGTAVLKAETTPRGIVVSPQTPRVLGPTLSILQMVQAGVETNIIAAYIDSSSAPFGISADDVLTLRKKGVSADVITAMLRHDAQIVQISRTNLPSAGSSTRSKQNEEPYVYVPADFEGPTQAAYDGGWSSGGFWSGGYGYGGRVFKHRTDLATRTVPSIPGTESLFQPTESTLRPVVPTTQLAPIRAGNLPGHKNTTPGLGGKNY
jgi:hypothetical protein